MLFQSPVDNFLTKI
uniref:Uncharacterized protein n=1 Tax=Rhizophora mucronata TaxID=61149 RepID=A0A2P2PGK3_RHIMU